MEFFKKIYSNTTYADIGYAHTATGVRVYMQIAPTLETKEKRIIYNVGYVITDGVQCYSDGRHTKGILPHASARKCIYQLVRNFVIRNISTIDTNNIIMLGPLTYGKLTNYRYIDLVNLLTSNGFKLRHVITAREMTTTPCAHDIVDVNTDIYMFFSKKDIPVGDIINGTRL